MLLKRLFLKISEKAAENIKSGFNKCGIIPLNRDRVLNMLPFGNRKLIDDAYISVPAQALNDSIQDFLQNMRSIQTKPRIPRKRLAVEPGKSVETISEDSDEEQFEPSIQPNQVS